jgi:hypothetical protein
MSEQWTIQLNSQPLSVAGFAVARSAQRHAEKHYLNPPEYWEQIQPSARESIAQARQVTKSHGPASREYFAFLEKVSVAYLGCVRVETKAAELAGQVSYVDERGQNVQRIDVVTKNGVYAAFSVVPQGQVSDLRTAMRLSIRTIKSPTRRHFFEKARAQLLARLSGAQFSDD